MACMMKFLPVFSFLFLFAVLPLAPAAAKDDCDPFFNPSCDDDSPYVDIFKDKKSSSDDPYRDIFKERKTPKEDRVIDAKPQKAIEPRGMFDRIPKGETLGDIQKRQLEPR